LCCRVHSSYFHTYDCKKEAVNWTGYETWTWLPFYCVELHELQVALQICSWTCNVHLAVRTITRWRMREMRMRMWMWARVKSHRRCQYWLWLSQRTSCCPCHKLLPQLLPLPLLLLFFFYVSLQCNASIFNKINPEM